MTRTNTNNLLCGAHQARQDGSDYADRAGDVIVCEWCGRAIETRDAYVVGGNTTCIFCKEKI